MKKKSEVPSSIGNFEELVLLAVLRLGRDDAYGIGIKKEIEAATGRAHSLGAIYTTLDRLESKGLVSSREGDPTPERGGRAKRFFEVEAPGITLLQSTRQGVTRLSAGLEPILGGAS
jgi:PadR family transcriptional regulator PadR